ncbi:MAG: hypothetical protein ACOYXT_04155 [Bacteroidota bacterium]
MAYENQLIGVFIYSLGIVTGKQNIKFADAINLIQQTPYDKDFGDILAYWQGKNFLIEFKRDEAGLKTEAKKPKRGRLLRKAVENRVVAELSIRCHFIAHAINTSKSSQIVFKSYLLFDKPDTPVIEHSSFVNKLKDPSSALGISDGKQFKIYLNCLTEASEADTVVSGLLVNASADGKIRFLTFESYHELALRLGLLKQHSISTSPNLENDQNQNQKKHSQQNKGIGMN